MLRLDYAGPERKRIPWLTVFKAAAALAFILSAMRLVYHDSHTGGWIAGYNDAKRQSLPPPTPLSERVKRMPPPQE